MKNLFFNYTFSIRIIVLFLFSSMTICHSHTFKRKYFPFKVSSQMDLLKPSLPFPGIFELSTPSAKFFKNEEVIKMWMDDNHWKIWLLVR